MKRTRIVLLAVLTTVVTLGGACKGKPQQTGLQVTVKNAAGQPVLSRVAVLQAAEGSAFPSAVTEAWAQPSTTGTLVDVKPGEYIVRAQGTGDSFLEKKVTVEKGKLSKVELGFATLMLDGGAVKTQGRVRVWQKREGGGEQIVVTRLVRPGEQAPIELAAGTYRVGFLPDGLTDEDKNFKPFGGEIVLESGAVKPVAVQP